MERSAPDRPGCDPGRQAITGGTECPDPDATIPAPAAQAARPSTAAANNAARPGILLDLPATDLSLLVKLPQLIDPDLQRLREAIEDDPDWGRDALTAVAEQIDTPQQRAQLADALVKLGDQRRITCQQAAAGILDLATGATRLLAASLLEAVAVSVGVSRTQSQDHRPSQSVQQTLASRSYDPTRALRTVMSSAVIADCGASDRERGPTLGLLAFGTDPDDVPDEVAAL